MTSLLDIDEVRMAGFTEIAVRGHVDLREKCTTRLVYPRYVDLEESVRNLPTLGVAPVAAYLFRRTLR